MMEQRPDAALRELGRRLLEASREAAGEPAAPGHEATVVTDRLRTSLTRFTGFDGYASLMKRALVLACEDLPELNCVKIGPDGRLKGWDQLAAAAAVAAATTAIDSGKSSPDAAAPRADLTAEAEVAITAHLLELLITFIGEPFTLKLVREAWPDEPLDEHFSRIEADR